MKKSERHQVYKNVLRRVKKEGWDNCGFCKWIKEETEIDVYWHDIFKSNFPELNKYRVIGEKYWFPTYSKADPIREKLLEKAIEETKPKSNGISKRGGTKKRASLPSVRKRTSRKPVVVRRVRKKSKTSKN